MKKLITFSLLLGAILLVGCEQDRTYEALAQCLDDSGAEFYGAFWCPNCENQLDMFGASKDLLPYTECAQGGKDAQPELCLQEGITSYPTWKFSDGRVITGTQSFESLADYSSCPLPGEEVESVLFEATE